MFKRHKVYGYISPTSRGRKKDEKEKKPCGRDSLAGLRVFLCCFMYLFTVSFLKSHVYLLLGFVPYFLLCLYLTQWAWILIRRFLLISFLGGMLTFSWFWWVNKVENYPSHSINDSAKRHQFRKPCRCKMAGIFLKSLAHIGRTWSDWQTSKVNGEKSTQMAQK